MDREEDFVNGRDDEDWLWEDEELCEEDYEFQWEYFTAKDVEESTKEDVVVDEASDGKEEVLNENDKLMIFTTGTKSYQAHQIGIKLMSKVKFRKKLNIPENIFKFTREAKQSREAEREGLQGRIDFEPTPWSNYREVAQMFDIVDVLIDFQGYVTGYGVSPDARSIYRLIYCVERQGPILAPRYLYTTVRPWPLGVEMEDPWVAPPCGDTAELVVVDLASMEVVGRSSPRQQVFVSGEEVAQSPVQVFFVTSSTTSFATSHTTSSANSSVI